MDVSAQIESLIAGTPEPKRSDLIALHALIQRLSPGCWLWFSDGKDETGKIVSNPTIGYGVQTLSYADGKEKEWFRIGLSVNKTGLSVYILGFADKAYLANTYGPNIGKAKVTGYCIRFKKVDEVRLEVLEEAIRDGLART